MQKYLSKTIFLIAAYALSTGATAQNVYKCGNSYSQEPCPGGTLIDVTDQRTKDQKKQTDMAAISDAKTADKMEKTRLRLEKENLHAQKLLVESNKKALASQDATPKLKKKKKGRDDFIAQVAVEKKKPRTKRTAAKSVP